MRKIALFTLALVSSLGFVACSDYDSGSYGTVGQRATADNPDVYPLMMGRKDTQVGEVRVWNDSIYVYVVFQTYAGYELADSHLCIDDAPFAWTAPGQCLYKDDSFPADTTQWEYLVPIDGLVEGDYCDVPLYLQAHASILNAAGASVGSAYGQTFKGQLEYVLSCEPPREERDCTLTQGYWKNHEESWPVMGLTIGGVTYTQAELLALLMTPTTGDASLILGHQLIASLLNEANGASVNSEVAAALSGAQNWMTANVDADGRLPYGVPSAIPTGTEAVSLSVVLDNFNNGLNGPPHCE